VGGDEYNIYGYDIICTPQRRGKLACGVHFSREAWERKVAAIKEAAIKEAAIKEATMQQAVQLDTDIQSGHRESLTEEAGARGGRSVHRRGETEGAGGASELDEFTFDAYRKEQGKKGEQGQGKSQHSEEKEEEEHQPAPVEIEDPTEQPIIQVDPAPAAAATPEHFVYSSFVQAIIGRLDLEVYADAQVAVDTGKTSMTRNQSIWRAEDKAGGNADRMVALQIKAGVEAPQVESVEPTLKVQVLTATGAGVRFRGEGAAHYSSLHSCSFSLSRDTCVLRSFPGISIRARIDRLYMHAVKLG
jgi:hypothetical protein